MYAINSHPRKQKNEPHPPYPRNGSQIAFFNTGRGGGSQIMNENNVGSISTRQMELRNGGTFNLFIDSFFFSFPTRIRGERERERG